MHLVARVFPFGNGASSAQCPQVLRAGSFQPLVTVGERLPQALPALIDEQMVEQMDQGAQVQERCELTSDVSLTANVGREVPVAAHAVAEAFALVTSCADNRSHATKA